MSLRTRIERMEAAHAAAREANPISATDVAIRLAVLLSIGHAGIMALTARARSVYEKVSINKTPAPQIALFDRDAREQSRQTEADRVTALIQAEAAADAAARRAAELEQAAQPEAPSRQTPDWFAQFKPGRPQ